MPSFNPTNTPIANPSDAGSYGGARGGARGQSLYRFHFGAYGARVVYAWDCHTMSDALEAAAEWCREHAPGVFTEPDYDGAAADIGAPEDWRDDPEWADKVRDRAEVDLTYTESGYIASWEWSVTEVTDADEYAYVYARSRMESDAESPDAETFAALHARYASEG